MDDPPAPAVWGPGRERRIRAEQAGCFKVALKSERWLDHTGLNLIRIVIGSYFMAISLGLIGGFDQSAMFAPILPEAAARLVGTVLLFILAVGFMSGMFLRITALTLALFVLCSSVIENYLQLDTLIVSSFWRDLTLACAVLLCYSSLKRRELRKAALLMRRRGAWRARRGQSAGVMPRRVCAQGHGGRQRGGADYDTMLRPLIAPTGPIGRPGAEHPARVDAAAAARPTAMPGPLRLLQRSAGGEDEDEDNIFSNI